MIKMGLPFQHQYWDMLRASCAAHELLTVLSRQGHMQFSYMVYFISTDNHI